MASQLSKSRRITNKELQTISGNSLQESMRIVDLGARTENYNNRTRLNHLYEQFPLGTTERRMCFFLNEMEVELKKYEELKQNASYLSVKELSNMKK